MKAYLGIDNGVSGSIGIVREDGSAIYEHTPIHKELNYTKVKRFLNRVQGNELRLLLSAHDISFCMIERPLVNPVMFQSTLSAVRALEATLIILESLGISYGYIDSKEWQKALLPKGLWKQVKNKKGKRIMKANPEELKSASLSVAKRLFPRVNFYGFKDGDGVLIAEYCRRMKR